MQTEPRYFEPRQIPYLKHHTWKFDDDDTASKLFDILMLSELGVTKDFDVFDRFNIRVKGCVGDKAIEIGVKNIEISPEYKSILIIDEEGKEYMANLDESVAQFVKKFWGD